MYKLLIVDDEYTIRTGLSIGIPWNELGFEVCAALDDGDEAIEYLKRNSVDVLLTDIRMSRVSGLDVAEYVNAEHPETFVVLISGYQDFEFAQKAISLGVERYILKPIQTSEIRQVFSKLRERLDIEQYDELKYDRVVRDAKVRLRDAKALWLEELYNGIDTDPESIKRHVETFFPDARRPIRPSIIGVTLTSVQEYLKNRWPYGEEAFNDVLLNALESGDGVEFFKINTTIHKDRFPCICISTVDTIDLDAQCREAARRIRTVLNIDASVEVIRILENFEQLAGTPFDAEGPDDEDMLGDEIEALKKLFLTNISLGHAEAAKRLVEGMFVKLNGQPFSMLLNLIIDVLATARARLKADAAPFSRIGFYDGVIRAKTPEILLSETQLLVDELVRHAAVDDAPGEPDVIEQAVRFIDAHYTENISLASVADAIYISRNYLCSQFKKKTGLGFHTYLMSLRIERSMELLAQGKKIHVVGRMVGYPDARYFARNFRQHTGMTPSEYVRGRRTSS